MRAEISSIRSSHGSKSAVEKAAEAIFTACGFFAVLAVASITLYMIINGTPALFQVGLSEILFGTLWQPAAENPSFGILYVILTSITGTFLAILIGVPIGVMTAIFLAEVAPKRLSSIVRPAIELLAGIPSVIYGLLGILILNPLMYKLELALFKGSETHQFTGGANLISAVLVLALMILPTVINICPAGGSGPFKERFPGVRGHQDPDDLPGDCSGSQIRHHHSGCAGNRKSHRRGYGDQPCFRKLCESSSPL